MLIHINKAIDEADEMIMKAEKSDQDAHMIMEKRLGRRFASISFYYYQSRLSLNKIFCK